MVEKIKKLIPIVFFCLFGLKTLVWGANWAEVSILTVVGILAGFLEYYSNSSEIAVFHKRLDVVDKHLTDLYKENESLRSYVTAQKMTTNIRTGNSIR